MFWKYAKNLPENNHTEATLLKSHFDMMFSCKFAAHFQNTFSWELGGLLLYCKKLFETWKTVDIRFLNPLFSEDPSPLSYFAYTSFFKFCQPPHLYPTALFVTLFNGWMGDRVTFDVLLYFMIDIMDLDMSSLDGSGHVFHATRHQVYLGQTCNVVFY